MKLRVSCPNPSCGSPLSAAYEHIGRRARCGRCDTRFIITGPPPDSVIATEPPTPPPSTLSDLDPAKENQPPNRLGRYEIRQKLGSGAFGTVYLAYDPVMDREVALKIPHRGLIETPNAIDRFVREARAAARLRHPNIVPAFDAGQIDGRYYMASAFVKGKSLAQLIGGQGMNPLRAARIIQLLADALHHAHQQGIVHRDVKPSNILMDAEDMPHLMDFGLARVTGSEAKLTVVGSILGTPAYLAPEQATGRGPEADASSDQYSLGVTFFELLTGQTPFFGPLEVVIYATIHQPIPSLRSINPNVPAALDAICLQMLSKSPQDRYATCKDVVEDLRRWLAGMPIFTSLMAASPEGTVNSPDPDGKPGAIEPWQRDWLPSMVAEPAEAPSIQIPVASSEANILPVTENEDSRWRSVVKNVAMTAAATIIVTGLIVLVTLVVIAVRQFRSKQPVPVTQSQPSNDPATEVWKTRTTPGKDGDSDPANSTVPPNGNSISPAIATPAPTVESTPDGFQSLFNGSELSEWKNASVPGAFEAHQREIVGVAHPYLSKTEARLFTRKTYENFQLKFKMKKGEGIAELMIHSLDDVENARGVTPNAIVYKLGGDSERSATSKPRTKNLLPEWDDVEVEARGARITLRINQTSTAENFPLKDRRGTISFGVLSGEVQFKDLWIKELESDRPAFPANINDEVGFQTLDPHSQNWKTVGDGVCRIEDDGSIVIVHGPGHLQYEGSPLEDFKLRVDFLVQRKRDEAGLLVRIPTTLESGSNVAHNLVISGNSETMGKIEIGDYAEPVPNMNQFLPIPLGTWNRLEIVVKGNKYWVYLNGEQRQYFESVRKDFTGRIGIFCKDEKSQVRFHNIRIKKL